MGGHHHHHHGHSHGDANSGKTLGIAILLTLGFAIVEAIGGAHAGSLALMSDAGHMALDSVALLIAFLATQVAKRPPTNKLSYGLGRIEVLAASLSCSSMLIIAFFILYSAVHRLQLHHHEIHSTPVMIIAAIGLFINIMVAYVLMQGERTLNVRAALLHVFGDILGSIAALASGVVIYLTNWTPIDSILSIFIGLLIGFSSIQMLTQALHILMEGVPSQVSIQEINRKILSTPDVLAVHDLHIWNLSSQKIALSSHIKIKNLNNWNTIYYTLKEMLSNEYHINHITLQPEVTGTPCHHCPPASQ